MEQSYPIPNKDYMVLIISYTYNQENYVEETLKGFVMQKTNFPFVALVIDDASTDKTADVIRKYEAKYPNIIKGVYLRENHYSIGKSKEPYIKPWRDKCKYEALCEGDDYWIDPLKLQKQVDCLESNNSIGFIYTNFSLVDTKGMAINYTEASKKQLKTSTSGFLFYKLLRNNFPQTLTVIYRIKLLKEYNDIYSHFYDWPLFIHLCGQSEAVYLNDITGCYRINPAGMMHSNALNYDRGGYKTLSCAFKAFLDGKYTALSKFSKLKVWLYLCYRVFKRDIEDVDDIEMRANRYSHYSIVRYFVFAIAKLKF